jgi:hypothetical protein
VIEIKRHMNISGKIHDIWRHNFHFLMSNRNRQLRHHLFFINYFLGPALMGLCDD